MLLLVFAALILGGFAVLLAITAREADREVRQVRGEVTDQLEELQRTLRRELDRRLPAVPAQP